MFANYFKIALRQLWRNRLFTALNVVGLAIGLSACWIIFRMVSYEFAFDKQHPHVDRTYRVVSRFKVDGQETGNAGVPAPMLGVARTSVAGVERALPYIEQWMSSVYVPQPLGKPSRFRDIEGVVATDAVFF